MKKYTLISIGVALFAVGYFFFFGKDKNDESSPILAKSQKGDFVISVTTTGELEAKNSVDIYAPTNLRKMGINQIKVSSMVDEGTILNKGDYVATLDPSEIGTEIRKLYNELSQKESDLKAAKLDTSLTMRAEREKLLNLKVELEETALELEQSKYEPPATQRKIEIKKEKIQRNYTQAVSNIKLKEQQAVAKVFKVQSELMQIQDKVTQMEEVMQALTITAPQKGMLVYYEGWNGKVKPGSKINTWNPVVAKIPDLSEMISKTFVNEIDISKIAKEQEVNITVDAFPDLKLKGVVETVANIGQEEEGGDAKVFEVKVKLTTMDSVLKPAMTTSNEIIIETLEDVVYIPIEAVFSNDSLQFVYKKDGNKVVKQQVITGKANSTSIVVVDGIKVNESVFLVSPSNAEQQDIVLISK